LQMGWVVWPASHPRDATRKVALPRLAVSARSWGSATLSCSNLPISGESRATSL